MSEKIATIDLKEDYSTLDINNISWGNYSHMMIALESMVLLLKKGYKTEYPRSHRGELIEKYEILFHTLKKGYPKYRAEAETLDDIEIMKALKYLKI